MREFKTLGIVLGCCYLGSPIIVDDGSAPPVSDIVLYVPSAHPGCLAPHLWLEDWLSLYDHFGTGFTLLVAASTSSDGDLFAVAAAERAIPLKVVALRDARFPGSYGARFVLVRLDQHMAWRGDAVSDDVQGLLGEVTGHSPAPDRPGASSRRKDGLLQLSGH